jgi:hypothetical protein
VAALEQHGRVGARRLLPAVRTEMRQGK